MIGAILEELVITDQVTVSVDDDGIDYGNGGGRIKKSFLVATEVNRVNDSRMRFARTTHWERYIFEIRWWEGSCADVPPCLFFVAVASGWGRESMKHDPFLPAWRHGSRCLARSIFEYFGV